MSKYFSFCHISDLHLSIQANQQSIKDIFSWYQCKKNNDTKKYGRFTTYERVKLEALCRFIYLNKDKFDFILITGDISSSASEDDLNSALSIIKPGEKSKLWIKDTPNFYDNSFYLAHKPIILLPGNHDRIDYDGLTSFKYSDKFDEIFKYFWVPSTPSNKISAKSIFVPTINETINLLTIDFSLNEGRFKNINIGEGYVEEDIINELDRILKFYEDNKIFYIIALHYPPKSENVSTYLKLNNEEKFINLLNKYKVPFIFSGHSHIEEHNLIPNTSIRNYCSDSSTSFCENSNINIFKIDFELNKIIDKKTFKWSSLKRNFYE